MATIQTITRNNGTAHVTGTATANATVTVTSGSNTVTVTAGADGKWAADIAVDGDSISASSEGGTCFQRVPLSKSKLR